MVEHAVRVDGQVPGIVCIGVVYPDDNQPAEECPEQDVDGDTEGDDERVYVVGDDVPVKGRQRVEAQTLVHAGNGGQGEVLRGDPGNPVEDAESCEDVIRKPEVHKHEGECCSKEAILRNAEDLVQGAWYGIVHL